MFSFLVDLFFPQACKICERIGGGIVCKECLEKIEYSQGKVCRRCTRALPLFNGLCKECSLNKWYFKEALFLAPYRGVIKEIVHLYKYGKRHSLHKLLSSLCVSPLKRRGWEGFEYIVPVPLHKERERERGFNQAYLLAKALSKKVNARCLRLLKKIKNTPSQTELDYRYRQENVKGSFKVCTKETLRKKVLLVDDVFTTGATANECARLLSERGAEVYFLAICYTLE